MTKPSSLAATPQYQVGCPTNSDGKPLKTCYRPDLMDVTCERCSTEYEFDETLVSERGTTVKCTNCGHLFKVFRATSDGERPWILKRQNGSTEALRSLRELQQRIAKGKVSEDDSISRSGEAWKRLGDIAELKTFFQAAEAGLATTSLASTPPQQGKNARKATLFGLGKGVPSSAPSRPAPPLPGPRSQPAPASRPPPRQPTPPSSVPAPPPRPKPVPAPPPRPKPVPAVPATPRVPSVSAARPAARPAPRPAPPPAPRPAPKGPRAPGIQAAGQARAPRLAEPTQNVRHQSRDDANSPERKGRPLLWAFLILLIAGGVATGILWDQISPMLGLETANPAQAFLDAGDEALASGHVDGYASAIRAYTQATAVAPNDPAVLTALGRAEAAWAQVLAFQVADLEKQARNAESTDAATAEPESETDQAELTAAAAAAATAFRQQANPIREEQHRHARAASESADAALDIQANGPAEVVAANAARLLGESGAAAHHLDRAGEMFQQPNADFHLAKALQAGTDGIGEALEEARAALSVNENFIEARLVIARALLARGNADAARIQLDNVLATVADHPRATALRAALADAPAVIDSEGNAEENAENDDDDEAAQLAGVADENEDPAEVTPSGSRTSGMVNRDPSNRAPAVDDDSPPPEGREYSWYNREGDNAMDRGATGRAREFYQMALEERPGASEALTGLGYVELERGRASSAIRYFQQARRNQYGDAYIGLGAALRRLGRNAEAVTVYEDYLESRPNGPQASVARRQIQALRPEPAGNAGGTEPTTAAPTENTAPGNNETVPDNEPSAEPIEPASEPETNEPSAPASDPTPSDSTETETL